MSRRSLACLTLVLGACAGAAPQNPDSSMPLGSGGSTLPVDRHIELAPPPPPTCEVCEDWPAAPIIDPGAPDDAPSKFSGDPPTSGGPCITEPENGAMFPKNWLRPRINYQGASAPLYQIRFKSPREKNDLVVYTTKTVWAMPKEYWEITAAHIYDSAIEVTVWAQGGGASQTTFLIAPVEAKGSMVFWAANPLAAGDSALSTDALAKAASKNSELRGFAVGDESTTTALNTYTQDATGTPVAPQIEQLTLTDEGRTTRTVRCIGCHTSTPDGKHVAFVDWWPNNIAIAAVEPGRTGKRLNAAGTDGSIITMTTQGEATVRQNWTGMMAFSRAHWSHGDAIMIAPFRTTNPSEPWCHLGCNGENEAIAKLAWFNVEATEPLAEDKFPVIGTHFGFISTGDARSHETPSWTHDGTTIAYASSMGPKSGRLEVGATDIYTVPYNARQGGTAAPLPGAATATSEEYYPAYSPDDQLIAFNRVPSGARMYANPAAEVFAIPATGGEAVRLQANDPKYSPESCATKKSPGINNHWPKWSPEAMWYGNRTYYWLVFSSNRADIPPVRVGTTDVQISQLYMTCVVVGGELGGIQSYPAVYLWNQPKDTINTTPAWDTFSIPIVQ